jgi:hypothetical protein
MVLWLPRWFRQDGRLTQNQVAASIARMAIGALVVPSRRGRPTRRTAKRA